MRDRPSSLNMRWLLAGVLAACGSSSGSSPPHRADGGTSAPAGNVDLPGGSGGVGFDDIRFSTGLRRIVSAPGNTGKVDLVDPDTLDVTSIDGFTDGTESAD